MYDPVLARFVSADTIIPGQDDKAGASNPQNLNRYSYGLNNPIRNTDPTGHCSAGLSWGMVNGQCYQEALHQYMDPSRSGTDRAIGFIYAQADMALVSVAAVATAGIVEVVAAGGVAAGGTVATAACSDGDYGNEVSQATAVAKNAATGLKLPQGVLDPEKIQYTPKVIGQMIKDDFHGFPRMVDGYLPTKGVAEELVGGDGIARTIVKIAGSYTKRLGNFEYIFEPDGITVNHRFFKPDS